LDYFYLNPDIEYEHLKEIFYASTCNATAIALVGPGALVMALPNLVALLGLSRVVITLTNNYIKSSHIA
jgi:Na+/alanine symporter